MSDYEMTNTISVENQNSVQLEKTEQTELSGQTEQSEKVIQLQLPNKKGFKDYTDEEKAAIIKRSNEVGIHQTAKEFGTNWQLVVAVRTRCGAGKLSQNDKYINGSQNNSNKSFKHSRGFDKLKQKELLRENAILKKEIATLSWQIDRLQIAMRELVE